MTLVGVNGIASDGEASIDILLRLLSRRGLPTYDLKLPWRHWFTARFKGRDDGDIVAKGSRDGDILIAHSYGCMRAWHAHQQRDYTAIICIAPAMSHKAKWRYPERVHCFHSKSDWAVRFGSWLLLHPFGRAGNIGFRQGGVLNNEMPGAGHGDYFAGKRLVQVSDYIAAVARGGQLSTSAE